MEFNDAQAIDQICWSFRLADWPRSLNRAAINNLFNGVPPYSDSEVLENNINVNVNHLESTRLAHDARSQFYQAFLKPGNYFTARTDYGPVHRRQKYGAVVTKEINRIMKRSLPFTEKFRSTFAQDVLHGIGPGGFKDADSWCPEPLGIDDVMVPSGTLLTMDNLPFFAIHRSFTGPQLIKMTRGTSVDSAWNKPLVDACLKWIDEQSRTLMGTNWPEVWTPEKAEERMKGSGTFYSADNCPTIECWDFYFWNDDKNVSGWNRRMILDAWSTPATVGGAMTRKSGELYEGKDQFLYNSGSRKWADRREEIINWQFADLSAVAPFRYHSVRSLGFLLYAVCHLQNRLRCKFAESVFEQLMVYFRVNSADEMQRALKIELANRGFVDDSVQFIPAADRYQVNTALVQLGLNENANIINRNANSNSLRSDTGSGRELPTATQWMGEEAKVTQLVSAGLLQAYLYQAPEYREIFRRFCRKNSTDPDVIQFRANCLRHGVPEKLINQECWELEPERVMGAGNKTLEMAIAQQLMQYRNLYDPEPQRQILRDVTLAITDDPGRAESLVPEQPMKVSDSVHDAQLVAGTLMQGLPVAVKTGMNHIEYVETLLPTLAMLVQKILKQQEGMATQEEIIGLNNLAAYINQHIQLIAQDKNEKARVKQYGDNLGKIMNEVKGFEQRLQEQMKKQAEASGADAETQAKIKSMLMISEAKAANTRQSHAERTVQRRLQFEQEQELKRKEFELELQQGTGEAQAQNEIRIANAEAQQTMTIAQHKAKLEAGIKQAELRLKKMQVEQEIKLREQEAELRLEIAEKDAELKRELAKKQAAAKAKATATAKKPAPKSGKG